MPKLPPLAIKNPRLQFLIYMLPGILVWCCLVGYLLGGLAWPAYILVSVLAVGCLLLGVLSARWLSMLNWAEWIRPLSLRPVSTLLLAGVFISILFGLATYLPLLIYPAEHSLKVCVQERPGYDREHNPFLIRALQQEDGPFLPLVDMKGEQPWNLLEEGLLAQADGACASYRAFFKGGLFLHLRQGPGAYSAILEWDGVSEIVDLDYEQEGTLQVFLSGDHPVVASPVRTVLEIVIRFSLFGCIIALGLVLALAFRNRAWGTGSLEQDNIWLALACFAFMGLLATTLLGHSTALLADDFCYSGVAVEAGVLDGTRQFYTSVNGRLFGNLLGLISGHLFPLEQPVYIVLIVLFLWVASLAYLLTRVLDWLIGSPRATIAWTLAATIVLVTLINTPDIDQSLFWRSGRQPLLPPLLLMSPLLALLLSLARLGRGARQYWKLLAILLLSFVAAPFHEVFAVAQVAGLLAGILALVIIRRQTGQQIAALLKGLLAALMGALAGLLVHVFSPGTAERSTALGANFDLLRIAYGSLFDSSLFLFAENLNILTIALFVLGVALVVRSSESGTLSKTQSAGGWLGVPLVVWCAVLASFAVGHYGISGTMPERAQIIPTFLATLGALIWGMLCGSELIRHGQKINEKWLQAVQMSILCVLGVAFLFHGFVMLDKQEPFDHYRRAVNVMISNVQSAQQRGAEHVVVSALPENTIGVLNPGTDQMNFVNVCVNQLFGLEVGFD